MRLINETDEKMVIEPGEEVELVVSQREKVRSLATRTEYLYISGLKRFASG